MTEIAQLDLFTDKERGPNHRAKLIPAPHLATTTLAGFDPARALADAGVTLVTAYRFPRPIGLAPDTRPHPGDLLKDHEQLVILPVGWRIIDLGPSHLIGERIRRFNLVDERNRVRATIRRKLLRDDSGATFHSSMRVACPFMFSLQQVSPSWILPYIRLRYGGVVWQGAEREVRERDTRGAVKQRLRLMLFRVLNRYYPDWQFAARYWDIPSWPLHD